MQRPRHCFDTLRLQPDTEAIWECSLYSLSTVYVLRLSSWIGVDLVVIYSLPITVCACPWCSKLYLQCQTEEYQVDQSNTNWQSILRKNLWTGTLNSRKSVHRSIYLPTGQVLTHWNLTHWNFYCSQIRPEAEMGLKWRHVAEPTGPIDRPLSVSY
jgi:hypothetical protein